jgi:hypothetical protein
MTGMNTSGAGVSVVTDSVVACSVRGDHILDVRPAKYELTSTVKAADSAVVAIA